MYKQGIKWWSKRINKYNKKQAIIKKFAGTKYRALVFAYNFLNKKTFFERNIKQGIMSYIKGEREAVALPVIKRAIALSYARTLCYKLRRVKGYKAELADYVSAGEDFDTQSKDLDLAIKTHKKALKNIPSVLMYKARKCDKDKKSGNYTPMGWYSYCPPSWNGNEPYKDRETMVCEGVDEMWSCVYSFRGFIRDDKIYQKHQQNGEDLGIRMKNAFKDGFNSGYQKVMIIGSDLYDLSPKNIENAFTELNNNDVVIGPALDGGYYLLGMNSLQANIFENKDWGKETVSKDTLENLKDKKVKLLELKNDIDIYEDIIDIPEIMSTFINSK